MSATRDAATLREAARVMRERAQAATPGPWATGARGFMARVVYGEDESIFDEAGHASDATHIASWHPVVAFAVADLLDHEAAWLEERNAMGKGRARPSWRWSIAVARAYLGEGADDG